MARKRSNRRPVVTNNNKNLQPVTSPTKNNGSNVILGASITKQTHFSGPIPHPEILAQYNNIIPNGAERILAMAEKQQEHRISLESFVVHHDAKSSDRGQYLGFILSIILGGGGIVAVLYDKNIPGLVMFFSVLASLVGIFVKTSIDRKKELDSRSKTISEKNKK